jgi:NADPH:quinone reductase-like Zn-dependent oxidoreductase
MEAMVYEKYGPPDVLHLKDVAKPAPKADEVLVKVVAASVNPADWHLLRADPFMTRMFSGLLRPKYTVLGADIAGRVEAVGAYVKRFKPGDEVFGDIFESHGGAFAEYAIGLEKALALKPAAMSFDEAAAVPLASVTALQGLRDKGHLRPGHKVLINGSSGGVGTFAVQIAKALGAEVTGVCSAKNLDLVRSLGADHVIDYTKENFTKGEKRYDLILGVNGFHPIADYKRALAPNGTYVMAGGSGAQMFQAIALGPWMSMGNKKLGSMMAKPNQNDLAFIKELLETGKLKPVIDRRFPLSQVAEAIRYLELGHARGKVVITVAAA